MNKIPIVYFLLNLFLYSCGGGKPKEVSITGKWKYEKMESYSGEEIDMKDPDFQALHEANKNLSYIFGEDYSFSYTNSNHPNKENADEKGTYSLSDDKKFLITKDATGIEVRWQVIELSAGYLKINATPSSTEYIVMKREK